MRWRAVAIVSLGANLGLASYWLVSSRQSQGWAPYAFGVPSDTNGVQNRTNIVLRRQFFSWREIESEDYPTYIINLRGIGCPEPTVRDIIIADVNTLFARRRANELITPEQQWWRSDADTNVVQAALAKARALEDERRALLTRLLGTNWESGDLVNLPRPSRPAVALDGPLLGALPTDTKQAVQEINERAEERLAAYLESQRQQGKAADPMEVAKLRQLTRVELASVLSPEWLEEYLLRYSQYANALRADFGKLQFFNPTADEFRAVFRATDNLDYQIQVLGDSTDPISARTREALLSQREQAVRTALGPKRYEEYQLLQDPLYRDAVATAQAAGAPQTARNLYLINMAAAASSNSIYANASMTPDQKAIELKQLELDQLKANTLVTGGQLPPQPTPSPNPIRRTYTLRQGDSPAVIGMIYGVPESAIRAANPNVDFRRLRAGDSINIPRNALTPVNAPPGAAPGYSPSQPSGSPP
jgi:hypothetical protein